MRQAFAAGGEHRAAGCPVPPAQQFYFESQYTAFTRKMFDGRSRKMALTSRLASKLKTSSTPLRSCCQTRKSADPGRYSHRITALPRRECTLKFGLLIVNDGDEPVMPSGSS